MDVLSSEASSPDRALVMIPNGEHEHTDQLIGPSSLWRPILSDSFQVVLYNPTSHALSVRPHSTLPPISTKSCPFCHRPMDIPDGSAAPFVDTSPRHSRAANYFHLLEVANETASRPSTPGEIPSARLRSMSGISHASSTRSRSRSREAREGESTFTAGSMAEGYFKAFFKEEYRLGMGANGSVYLCQHVLDGNPLGHFAVKKIAVGQSHSYLYQTLREVRLLETLRHPNIITYHHAWLESCQFSSFGPKVPTLFVLMQWAEGGSLDDFIDARLGKPHSHPAHPHTHQNSPTPSHSDSNTPEDDAQVRAKRIEAFREAQRAKANANAAALANGIAGRAGAGGETRSERRQSDTTTTAVHLLSAEEAKRLFCDVVTGLAFLHDRSILHLDLKPGNVLLTWDEGSLIPRAMLSDFGTSQDMLLPNRKRSGNTGTLEYCAPESLPSPKTGKLSPVDSKADMWSLGMILHRLLFFKLPYRYSSDGDARTGDGGDMDRLEREVQNYGGFKSSQTQTTSFEARGLPSAYLFLLERLLNKAPKVRPSSEQVLRGIREGNLDPLPLNAAHIAVGEGTLIQRAPTAPHASVPSIENGQRHGPYDTTVVDASSSDDDIDLLTSSRNHIFRGETDDDSSSVVSAPTHLHTVNEKWEHAPSPLRSPPFTSTTTRARARSKSGQNATYNVDSEPRPLPTSFEELQAPLLALPSPPLPLPASPRPMPVIAYTVLKILLTVWNYPWPWTRTRPYNLVRDYVADWLLRNQIAIIRGLKSSLLVAKILMLFNVCSDGRPDFAFAFFVIAVAVVDTWSEDLWMSLLLGVLHVVILRMHCQDERCCA